MVEILQFCLTIGILVSCLKIMEHIFKCDEYSMKRRRAKKQAKEIDKK